MKKEIVILLFCFLASIWPDREIVGQSLPGSGNAYDMSGVNAHATISNFGALEPPFTITAWVYYDPNITGSQTIFSSDNDL